MNSIFDINDFRDGSYLMRCDTKEQSDHFRAYLHNLGKSWCDGDSYIDCDKFRIGEYIYYAFNIDSFGTNDNDTIFVNMGYKIIYFDDFSWCDYKDPYEEIDEELDKFLCSFITNS